MANKIKIDIVSDVVCPWCTVGYKRLEKAISELGIQDKVEIEWQPFELNPTMSADGQNLNEHMMEKYRICLLYTSPSPRDQRGSRMPSSA